MLFSQLFHFFKKKFVFVLDTLFFRCPVNITDRYRSRNASGRYDVVRTLVRTPSSDHISRNTIVLPAKFVHMRDTLNYKSFTRVIDPYLVDSPDSENREISSFKDITLDY